MEKWWLNSEKYGVHGIYSWFVLKADLLLAEIIRNKNISENDLEMGRSWRNHGNIIDKHRDKTQKNTLFDGGFR